MKQQFTDTWHWLRRYISFPLLLAVGYLVFILFYNENSYTRSAELQDEINRLEAEIKENNDTMIYYNSLNRSLDTDPATLERLVREKYQMKRPNEDVYVIED